jgi:hypothetical protein
MKLQEQVANVVHCDQQKKIRNKSDITGISNTNSSSRIHYLPRRVKQMRHNDLINFFVVSQL